MEPVTCAEAEDVYAKWLHDPDPVPTRLGMATYVANMALAGDPVWLMEVGGSGIGKTERITPVSAMPHVVMASTLTGEAALLSASPKRERAANATGGLLRLVGERGILVVKDFTSVLSMSRDRRPQVIAAMREIYDGRWDRHCGTDGGQVLSWQGKCGFITGCTTAIVFAQLWCFRLINTWMESHGPWAYAAGRRFLVTGGAAGWPGQPRRRRAHRPGWRTQHHRENRMRKRRTRTLAVTGIMIVTGALVTLSTTAASAATTTASVPGHVAAAQIADSSGCVTEDFSEADEGTYEVCVLDEQVLLNNLWNGYVLSNLQELTVDGYYGPETESDVLFFQADAGITRDGITGPQTWWWLCHINAINGFQGAYWHGAGCATEGSSPPS